jgi:hypothetical protein
MCRWLPLLLVVTLCLSSIAPDVAQAQAILIARREIMGPPESVAFGRQVAVLANGNIVVTDPDFSADGMEGRGAVYLYDGDSLALISRLLGASPGAHLGASTPLVLPNGSFVIRGLMNWSTMAFTWVNGSTGLSGVVSAQNSLTHAAPPGISVETILLPSGNLLYAAGSDLDGQGSVTWIDGDTGQAGVVSPANSLIGNKAPQVGVLANGHAVASWPDWDQGRGAVSWLSGDVPTVGTVSNANAIVGSHAFDHLRVLAVHPADGGYFVGSTEWDNGDIVDAGAVRYVPGDGPQSGILAPANALVGSQAEDKVGGRLRFLESGTVLVMSPTWHNAGAANAGAITWGGGRQVVGAVSALNSMVGSTAEERLGEPYLDTNSGWHEPVAPVGNGSYVVVAPRWDNGPAADAGAVRWASAASPAVGPLTPSNALVGSAAGDLVGAKGVTALADGNFVVPIPNWDSGTLADAGAVAWGSGAAGVVGAVGATNSLVGTTAGDRIGDTLLALPNGAYVVGSQHWRGGRGVATWARPGGVTGAVAPANSLSGDDADDHVGAELRLLANGNYLVGSPNWSNGSHFGAITWGNGQMGIAGPVSPANSLVGSHVYDWVGSMNPYHFVALPNGNFVLAYPEWDNGPAADAGAVVWGNGSGGTVGPITPTNALVGTHPYDQVGSGGINPLPNGNYVVRSPNWKNGAEFAAGAITWGSGETGVRGAVAAENSLVGSKRMDCIGSYIYIEYDEEFCQTRADSVQARLVVLENGDYVFDSPAWDRGAVVDAGAVTWGSGTGVTAGVLGASNSLIGSTSGDGETRSDGDDPAILPLGGAAYLIEQPYRNHGAVRAASLLLWSQGGPVAGAPAGPLSVEGDHTHGGFDYDFDAGRQMLLVGRHADQQVTVLQAVFLTEQVRLPIARRDR